MLMAGQTVQSTQTSLQGKAKEHSRHKLPVPSRLESYPLGFPDALDFLCDDLLCLKKIQTE